MLNKIKNKIESELAQFSVNINRKYNLNKIHPLLSSSIKDFILRDGKRIRPILFCIGYMGYSKKRPRGLYKSAISLELLHDFLLIHDDIIDKSNTRRGRPSMHAMLNKYLKRYKNIKFNGTDLAIVIGDIIYAMAIHLFLSIKENKRLKEKALEKFSEAAIYTGSGEFMELLYGLEALKKIKKEFIYQIYDLKTAYYSFSFPLVIGATLAGASSAQINKLTNYGICLGRAFQIKDDILGLFGEECKIGKSSISDLQEAKKTIIIWHAYNNSTFSIRSYIKKIFNKKTVTRQDLLEIRKIVTQSKSVIYAEKEISCFLNKAQDINTSLSITKGYKNILNLYLEKILKL